MREGIQGKVVLLTGGCIGPGAEIARYLAFRGARVAIAEPDLDMLDALLAQIRQLGGEAHGYPLDAAQRDQAKFAIDAVIADFGRLNVVINTGMAPPRRRGRETRFGEWDATIEASLHGVIHGAAAAMPVFLAQGYGHIVNLSEIAGAQAFASSDIIGSSLQPAARAITEDLRQAVAGRVRVTCILAGASEGSRKRCDAYAVQQDGLAVRALAIPASSVARAVAYAIEQPTDIDINEIVLRTVGAPAPAGPTPVYSNQEMHHG